MYEVKVNEYNMSPDALLNKLKLIVGEELFKSLKIAYLKAEYAHKDQKRRNGRPYITHPLRVAIILAGELNIKDTNTLIMALLHDVVEDTPVTIEEIQQLFGETIAEGVKLLTKADDFKENIEKQRKYFWHLKRAPKNVQLVKLADRLDNMRDLENGTEPFKIKKYCQDTSYNFINWAKKVSPYIAAELEDLLFIYSEKFNDYTN